MKTKLLTGSMIAAYALLNTSAFAEETTTLDPIVVSADFRELNLSMVSGSVSLISEAEIYVKSRHAFAEVVACEPNVNFSSGASNAK